MSHRHLHGCISQFTARLFVQVVREKVFLRLRQELPYELEVITVEHRTLPDGSLLLKQQILVPTEIVRFHTHLPEARSDIICMYASTARGLMANV